MRSVLLTLVLLNIGVAVDLAWLPSTDEVLDFVTPHTTSRHYISRTQNPTTTDQLIKKAGFQSEVHKVVTEDGYILRLTRIKTSLQGPPVLIVHGLFSASDMWVIRDRKENLAFILADNGFDVWLADLRGNVFSRKHLSLKDYQPEFWNFSFHEIGIYDLPAIITEILSNSLYPKVFYIGHSMGTTVFPILTSIRPEFNKYIQTAVLLSPIFFGVKDIKSKIIRQLFRQSDNLINIFKKAQVYNLLPRNNITEALIRVSCSKPVQEICLNLIGDMNGENRKNLNKAKIADFLITLSSGASTKTLEHFAQQFKSDNYKQFDYGEMKNLQVYGQPTPPHYNLNLVTVPMVLFYSNNDYLLDEKSVQRVACSLPNVIYKEALPKYSHLDYVFGNDSPKILYSKIVDIFYEKLQ